jgi:two-component system CheB/CheR fusion protein
MHMSEHPAPAPLSDPSLVPICALGASAGGVTALRKFFSRVRTDLNLAYVVVVHLSPDHPSALSEILRSCTSMSVNQVEDGPALKPNCVYVIPPDRELVIAGNSIAARPFTQPRGQRAPIDCCSDPLPQLAAMVAPSS